MTITRLGFLQPWKTGNPGAPFPLNIVHAVPAGNHYPLRRPLPGARGAEPGPALNYGGSGLLPLGIDPTDELTWGSRGYRQCAGMIGFLNGPDDWQGQGEMNPLGMQ
jgi:hypothetical protein